MLHTGNQVDRILLVADLAGAAVFAAEGALAAIAAGLDVFGVMVLAFATDPHARRRRAGALRRGGNRKALNFRMAPLIAALLGTITAFGGGTIRDILLGARADRLLTLY